MPKLNRIFELTIEPPAVVLDQNNKAVLSTDSTRETHVITNPISITFAVARKNLAELRNARFQIFNLNQSIREDIYHDPGNFQVLRKMTFKAGYENGDLSTIFEGRITECFSYRDEGSVDVITEINAFDLGGHAIINSFSKFIMAPPVVPVVNQKLVIEQLIKNLEDYGLKRGAVGNTYTKELFRGYTVCSQTWEALKSITGNTCYVDNGKVYCISDSEYVDGEIIVLDSDTGLLSTPKKRERLIYVDMVFEPSLLIGNLVSLESRVVPRYNGVYKITSIDHVGIMSESLGGKCRTSVGLYIPPEALQRIVFS